MKTKRFKRILPIFILAAHLTACSVVSRDIREKAVLDVSFGALTHHTEQYVGKTVILGGYIVELANRPDQSRLMILQAPLDSQDHPKSRKKSKGRFLVTTNEFLDPMLYEKGRRVTVAGKVAGQATEKIGDYAYTMPKIKSSELHLWDEPKYRHYHYHYYDRHYPWTDNYYHFWWHYPY